MNEVFDYVMMLHFRSKVQRFGENLKLFFFSDSVNFFFFYYVRGIHKTALNRKR